MIMLSDCLGEMRPSIAPRIEKPPVEGISLDSALHSTLLASTSEPATRPNSMSFPYPSIRLLIHATITTQERGADLCYNISRILFTTAQQWETSLLLSS
jgi:hypothetical protein